MAITATLTAMQEKQRPAQHGKDLMTGLSFHNLKYFRFFLSFTSIKPGTLAIDPFENWICTLSFKAKK